MTGEAEAAQPVPLRSSLPETTDCRRSTITTVPQFPWDTFILLITLSSPAASLKFCLPY